ncbi:hypothetical protein ACFL3I_12810 [Pseudomonadota bacterium]
MQTRLPNDSKKAPHQSWGKVILLSLFAIAAATANITHAQTCTPRLYGTVYDGPNGLASFYSINPETGIGDKIGATGFERISAFDVDPATGIIYAAGEEAVTNTPVLITIDRTTGIGTLVGEMAVNEPVAGMSIRNSDSTIFAFGSAGGVFTVDKSTGLTTTLTEPDADLSGNAIAFSPDDVLYHADDVFLRTVDQTTGGLTLAYNLNYDSYADDGFAPVTGMDYGPETGIYYAIVKNGKSSGEVFLAEIEGVGVVGSFNVYVNGIGYTADGMGGLAYFCEPVGPLITIEKTTNGSDADDAPGPIIEVGQPVTWSYTVTNTGNETLSNVAVSDDILGAISCPQTTLAATASMTCTASGTAEPGQYMNVGTATGKLPLGDDVVATDPSHYFGAELLTQMNAGLNDAWYYPVTNGQGFYITVFPDIGYVSLSWFTYDNVRPAEGVTANLGEPGHRWLNALGPYSGNQAVMDISYATGGIFDSPTEVTEVTDGTIILTFSDCRHGTVEYDIPSINQQGTVPLQRIVGDNIPLCEAIAEQSDAQQTIFKQKTDKNDTLLFNPPATPSEGEQLTQMNAGLNDAWYYPVTDGQGFYITVFPDISYVSLSWFTYDTVRPAEDVTANLGEPGHRWLNALGPYTGNQAVMDISYATGGIFDSPTEVTEISDGTIILTFTDCRNGTVEYDIPSINQKAIVPLQRIVGDNIPLCETLMGQ